MKKLLAILLCIAVVFSFAACGGSSEEPAADDQQSGEATDVEYPEMTLTCAGLDKEDTAKAHDLRLFIDLVKEKSGGKITFNEYWSAQLGVATANLDTIGQGIADVGTVCTLYTPTQLPLSQITYCVPFAPSDVAMAGELIDKISAAHP